MFLGSSYWSAPLVTAMNKFDQFMTGFTDVFQKPSVSGGDLSGTYVLGRLLAALGIGLLFGLVGFSLLS